MAVKFEVDYRWSMRVNHQATLRDKVGAALRSLAWRIDGRLSLAIAIESQPPLDPSRQVECVRFGLDQLKIAVADTVRAEAYERVLDALMREKHGTPS